MRSGSGVVETPADRRVRAARSAQGRAYTFEKYVGVDTALTSRAPAEDARETAHRAARRGWDRVFAANEAAWREDWSADVLVPGHGELQGWLRAAQYGLLASTRRGAADSIAPAGLTSDNYAGMVFWDAETWMFPGLLATRRSWPVRSSSTATAPGARPARTPRSSGTTGCSTRGPVRAGAASTPSARAGNRRTV
ncbi:hypothetical protein SCALM49S_03335 [Streptomyces californicus]